MPITYLVQQVASTRSGAPDKSGNATTIATSDLGVVLPDVAGVSNEAANIVYAGPTTGAAALPTFRALVAADIPDISATYETAAAATTALALKAPLASPTFTGTPTAPTAAPSTNTTQIATTAFVLANVGGGAVSSVFTRSGAIVATSGDYSVGQVTGAAPLASPTFTGTVTIPAAVLSTHTSPITVDTDGATITFDCAVTDWHSVVLGGNRTLALANVQAKQQITLVLVQDGTGSRTVTWFSGIKWAGGSAPTLTTTAAKADVFTLKQTGTGAYYGFVAGQNL